MSNVKTKSSGKKPVKPVIVVVYILLVILAVVYLAPLLWMLSVSLKDNAGVMSAPFSLPVCSISENYQQAWQMGKLGTALVNSVLVCGVTADRQPVLRRYGRFRHRQNALEIIGIYAHLLPHRNDGSSTLCSDSSFCKICKAWPYQLTGRTDDSLHHFFPANDHFPASPGFSAPMPGEMFEAAAIDGCGIYGCFFRIALPLCRTGFFVSGLMTFINNWNELLLAMVFISDPMKKTLPVTLTYFVGPYATNYVQMFAAIIIAIAPTVVVYSLFSNQIVEGLTTGAVKG